MVLIRTAGILALCIVAVGALAVRADEALTVAGGGKTDAVVVVSPEAGKWERQAATDLVKYIGLLSGAEPKLADQPESIAAALAGAAPALVVGGQALAADPSLRGELARVAKKDPVLRSDAIVLRRKGDRVYLAGNNDDAHYYAAAELLGRWGCRWYLPTEMGECIPVSPTLKVEDIDYAYAPPFEVRKYWISWVGDTTGAAEFQARNFMNQLGVPNGHILGSYTKDLVPPGKSVFNVPITSDKTAQHVAAQVEEIYAAGKPVQLGIEDGLYQSDDPLDKELTSLAYDKYFMSASMTDAFLVFYNKVADILMKKYPNSDAKIGFLAYANLTMPPVRPITAKKPLVAYLAPIDIDPIHSMEDPRSLPRREYKEMLYAWVKVMQGRVVIYDYDQGMLVWRDIPAPSHQMLRHDIHHYREAGILGIDTESRNAIATTFTNLFFRGQLMWNPDADVDQLLAEFYEKFYGPAAEPMARYWNRIYQAWEETIATEHEYFLAPGVYTDELVAALKKDLEDAETLVKPLAGKASPARNEKLVLDRMKFTRLSYGMIEAYTGMIRAAWTDADYATAAAIGKRGLAIREELTAMNGTFTTYKKYPENGPAWWPGEVQQYADTAELLDGAQGTLVQKLPREVPFRRDPEDQGLKEGWATATVDLSWYEALPDKTSVQAHIDNPGHWELLRTDRYIQLQGVISPEGDVLRGHGWYRLDLDLKPAEATGPLKLYFPGLFNECWLYVNGQEVAHRTQHPLWWMNDYRFVWDVPLEGKVQPGKNTVALRFHNPHHMGGMFRRPFLYRPK